MRPCRVRRLAVTSSLARIAQGGMGEVYRGVDVGYGGIERPVAVKLIAPALALDAGLSGSSSTRPSCRICCVTRTSSACATSARSTGDFFIAMEWVDGADLGTILGAAAASGGAAAAAALRLPGRRRGGARARLCASRCATRAGQPLQLVHRDVSPSNLLRARSRARSRCPTSASRARGCARRRRCRAGSRARSATWRRSRRAASRSMRAPTCSRSAPCCSRC